MGHQPQPRAHSRGRQGHSHPARATRHQTQPAQHGRPSFRGHQLGRQPLHLGRQWRWRTGRRHQHQPVHTSPSQKAQGHAGKIHLERSQYRLGPFCGIRFGRQPLHLGPKRPRPAGRRHHHQAEHTGPGRQAPRHASRIHLETIHPRRLEYRSIRFGRQPLHLGKQPVWAAGQRHHHEPDQADQGRQAPRHASRIHLETGQP